MNPRLYLIPSDLGSSTYRNIFPPENLKVINTLEYFIVENLRSARRFLRAVGFSNNFDSIVFFELNKHTLAEDYDPMMRPLLEGKDVGILSEAGTPAVADPGAVIVLRAHQNNIQVVPLIGPSSLLLALMASGTNGQRFCFYGYLPVKPPARIQTIKKLEKRSQQNNETQIFMETPYRNQGLAEDIVSFCNPETLFCIAADLTLETEYIQTRAVKDWKKKLPDLHKRPTIFLIYAGTPPGNHFKLVKQE